MNSTFDKTQSTLRKSLSTEDIPLIVKESPPNYISFRKRIVNNSNNPECVNDMNTEFSNFQQQILGTMNTWFAKQDDKLAIIIKDYGEMRDALNYVSAKLDDLEKKTEDTQSRTTTLESKVVKWDRQALHIQELEQKIDIMEQQSRQCNVEIFKLPEKRTENLVAIVHKIANHIDFPVLPQDLVSVHRVPHADKSSKQPKNVIVKFSSRLIRDNFLAAARKKKGMTTGDLDINGSSQPQIIFINEHLTLKNKLLYKDARDAAKINGFRYVWSQNGTVLVRASTASPIFAVRSKEEIAKKIRASLSS